MALLELGLTYETVFVNLAAGEHKAPAHTKLNPNGRVPTLIDHHNNDFTIWYAGHSSHSHHPKSLTRPPVCRESCAILLYLVEKYDPEHKLSVESFEDRMMLNQWLFFQASGQGYELKFLSMPHTDRVAVARTLVSADGSRRSVLRRGFLPSLSAIKRRSSAYSAFWTAFWPSRSGSSVESALLPTSLSSC